MEPFSLLQYAANYYSTRLDEMKTPAGECHTLVNADFDFAQGERARLSTARSRQHNPRLMNDEGGPTPLGQAAYGRAGRPHPHSAGRLITINECCSHQRSGPKLQQTSAMATELCGGEMGKCLSMVCACPVVTLRPLDKSLRVSKRRYQLLTALNKGEKLFQLRKQLQLKDWS